MGSWGRELGEERWGSELGEGSWGGHFGRVTSLQTRISLHVTKQ